MKKNIIKFYKKYNITENQFIGKETVGGYLDLGNLTAIPDGFNPTVGGSLYLRNLTAIPKGFNPTVGGYLDLRNLTAIPDGFNPTVGGSLYLGNLTAIPDGFNPTVGGYLDLRNLTAIPDGFNPTVGGSLDLRNLTAIPDGFNPTVGGSLYLRNLTAIPKGFNPTVGGYLDLGNLTAIPDGFNPTVGGYLDLGNLTAIPKGFNPTVGGSLYLGNLTAIPDGFNPTVGGYLDLRNGLNAETKKPKLPIKTSKNKLLFWQNGKYISADDILTEVVSKKGNIYKVKKIHSDKEFFLVTNGEIHAHGETIKKAQEDCNFKIISEKLKKEPIKADTMISVNYYRVITGACELGCKDFIQKNNLIKQEYRAEELLPILVKNNAYGIEKFKQLISF